MRFTIDLLWLRVGKVGGIESYIRNEKDALERVKKRYAETYFDMFYGDLRVIKENGLSFIKKSQMDQFVTSRHWNHPTTFITKKLYEKYKYDLNELLAADFDLFLRLKKAGVHIEIENEVIANYRLGGVSTKKNLKRTLNVAKRRYGIYRRYGYSRGYIFECYLVELGKYILV